MDITCSAKLAKELHELGWRKETTFYYGNKLTLIKEMREGQMMGENSYFMSPRLEVICSQNEFQMYRAKFSAPQFHEIVEVLPFRIGEYFLEFSKDGYEVSKETFYDARYQEVFAGPCLRFEENKNPHNAAAKLLVWCIKNKFVTL